MTAFDSQAERCRFVIAVALLSLLGGSLLPTVPAVAGSLDSFSPLQQALAAADWTESRFSRFEDGVPPSGEERREAWRLLMRLNQLDTRLWDGESTDHPIPQVTVAELVENPIRYRGQALQVVGQAIALEQQPMPADLPPSLLGDELHQVQVATSAGTMMVTSAQLPKAWNDPTTLPQPTRASGVFLKLCPNAAGELCPWFVAPRVGWFPAEVKPPAVSWGKVYLARWGVDVSRLDEVRHRQPLLAAESRAFYEVLRGVRRSSAEQMLRWADQGLSHYQQQWQTELLRSKATGDEQRAALAREVVRRAQEGKYSVAPLFNRPATQVGELIALHGTVRRAVRIAVGAEEVSLAGGDHYYELDLYTDDSQNFPLIVCMAKLPPQFPTGEALHEVVELAGFFFKSWRYTARSPVGTGGDEAAALRAVPLLIGVEPVGIAPAESEGRGGEGWMVGGGFALLLLLVCWTLWRVGRADRHFARDQLARWRQKPVDGSLAAGSDEPR